MKTKIEIIRHGSFEQTTQKVLYVYATFRTDSNRKRRLIDIHFPTETIRQIIDKAFIKTKS